MQVNPTKAVPPDGSPESTMWLFGEAPGAVEDRIGKPFVGPAGGYLDMGLRDAGLLRSEMFIWNIFTKHPPGNNINHYFQDKQNRTPSFEGEQMISGLRLMIQEYKPNIIVALGAIPLYILTGESGITKWRGSLLNCTLSPGVKVYPTYHPSYVMRLMQEKGEQDRGAQNVYPTFIKDLMRAQEQSTSRSFPSLKRKEIMPTTVTEIESYLSWLQGLKEPISCDIESINTGEDVPLVSRVGFAPSSQEGISIPFIKGGAVCWTLEEWGRILISVSELMINGPSLVFQNGFYDLTILGYIFGLRCGGQALDTMVQQHCVYPHLPKGLDYQASVYTWQPYYKEERKKHKAGILSEDALSSYNITDCCVTKEIQPITWQDAQSMGMAEGLDRTMSLYPSLMYMMLKGVKIDFKRRDEIKEEFTSKQAELRDGIAEIAGKVVNPKSPKQMQELLYHKLRFPIQMNRKTRKPTTDKTALNRLKKKTGHPIFDLIKDHRKYSKLLDTYIEMKVGDAGRMHTSYDPTGTVTWRLSSYGSHLGMGGALQTIPKRDEDGRQLREIFIADEGMEMGKADLRQAEDRYVIWKAGDLKGMQDYNEGKDPHWENCKPVFNVPAEVAYDKENPQHYKWRNHLMKHANHANNYLMGPVKFHELLSNAGFDEYTLKDCKELLAAMRYSKPFVEAWKTWVADKIKRDRTLITSLNRKKIFYGRMSDDLIRKAVAHEPQSTIGELLSICIRDLHEQLFEHGFEILLNVHDEVVFQYPLGKRKLIMREVKRIMERALMVEDIFGTTRELVIPIDRGYGPNWGKMEDYHG